MSSATPDESRCPHCAGRLSGAYSTGGPYRGVALNARRCKACGLTIVQGRDVAGYFDLSGNPNKRALLERKREKLRTRCGSCAGLLEQISLSATNAWVTLEECQRCLQIVLEDGEVESLKALIAEVANIPAG